jgi:HK97 family phage major capsid protein
MEEYDNARWRAKLMYEKAKSENREFTPAEAKEFDGITDRNTGTVARLKKQIAAAKAEQEQITKGNAMEHYAYLSNQTFGQNFPAPGTAPERVLPTNGKLPGEEITNYANVRVRPAKLKCFANERLAYDSGMWLRSITSKLYGRQDAAADAHCQRHGLDISNSAYEGSGVAGGYLVPAPLSQSIIETRERVGIARQVCQIQQMTADTLTIPKRSGGLTVYYPNELQTITDSDKSWGLISLTAKKRAVASKISQELVDDALISIVDNVVQEQAYALALREDQELCNGDGTSTYGGVTGLRSAIGTAGVYTCDANENLWSEIDLEDVIATMVKLPDRFNRDPIWICSSNFYWAVFARLAAAAAGNNIGSLEGGPTGRRFLGVPVLTTSAMPTADADSTIHALYGQFDMAAILGDRTGIRIGRDDSTGFLADYTTLKATSRYDLFVHEPGDSSNAGAYVGLKTNAA